MTVAREPRHTGNFEWRTVWSAAQVDQARIVPETQHWQHIAAAFAAKVSDALGDGRAYVVRMTTERVALHAAGTFVSSSMLGFDFEIVTRLLVVLADPFDAEPGEHVQAQALHAFMTPYASERDEVYLLSPGARWDDRTQTLRTRHFQRVTHEMWVRL